MNNLEIEIVIFKENFANIYFLLIFASYLVCGWLDFV